MAPPDIAALSASQQEALQTYIAVTNQEALAAIPLLQRCEWNVQIAIARFFDGEPTIDPLAEARASLPSASSRRTVNLQHEAFLAAASSSSRNNNSSSSRNNNNSSSSRNNNNNSSSRNNNNNSSSRNNNSSKRRQDQVEKIDTAASSITTHHQQPLLFSLLLTPFGIVYRVFSAVFSPLGFLVPGFLSRLLARLLTTPAAAGSTRRRLPPADNAQRFIREFGEEYGADHNLPFTEAGFNLTLDNAKKGLKFMLVVLLSPSHDDNATWVHQVLLSSQLGEWLATHKDEVLLWGGNVQDSEAYQVSASLQCTKFPFAALICQTADAAGGAAAASISSSSASGMTVIMRAVGLSIAAPELVAKLSAAVSAQQAQLQRARAQQAEQQATRNLRQEQDSAYERSLAQDRERARRRREEQEAQAKAEREARAAAEAAETRKRKQAQWKQWRAQTLPPDYNNPDASNTIRVSIRMPSGDRVIRKLRADAHLEELYAFVECYELIKERGCDEPKQEDEQVAEPDNYEHVYSFRLVSPMPRVVYKLSDGGSVGDRIGRAANLIVEPIDEDDDQDDDQDDV